MIKSSAATDHPSAIGHYQILSIIGRGGMGLVYLGVDTRLNRQVAIKCLRSELYESHYIERFKREAFLLAKLNHPNIVQIYDFIETPEQLALVMEFVDGQNLQQHLRENIVPYARRMRWLSQIAQGLAVAHDEGIIHRDLKAENILVNRRGEVRISDLGIAKSQDFNATLTDHVAGSYCSMSPEQALGETLDFKSDLFSFGILAYQLLCGVHPFGATDNKLQLMQRIISHPPASPMQHNPSLPVEICDLLGQLLSKDPARRPDSSHWLAAQWEALSLIPIAQEFAADNTLALPRSAESGAQKNHPSGEHLTYSQAGAGRPAYNPETDSYSHHTFDTRFVERARPHQSLGRRLVNYARAKSVTLSLSLLTLVILAGLLVWQLQPKPPKYIAVLPPKITAANLSDRQQVLVSAAVYDAIQQSLLGLDNYYLIPRTDIEDANGDTDIVRRATAADELISADIRCKDEVCHIALARLTPENSNSSSRLRVADSRSLDVLADNYLAIAEVVERSTSSIYLSKSQNIFENVQAQDYDALLDITRLYRDQGANDLLLDKLDAMRGALRSMQTTRSLYTDIALDLNYETEELAYLTRLERFLQQSATPDDAADLRNIYYLQIAQAKFNDAQQTLEKIAALSANDSYLFALRAYGKMAEKDYPAAIALYEKSLAIKTTATNLYYQAVAFWYSGDNDQAKARLNASLKISPGLYTAHRLIGLIELIAGDIPQAIISLQRAIAIKSTDAITLNNLGLCYLLSGDYASAKTIFAKAFAIAPLNAAHLLNIADAENLAGESELANKSYQEVIALLAERADTSENLINLTQAYAHLGKISKALTLLQTLERNDPLYNRTVYTAALIHSLAGNTASAVLNVQKSLETGTHVIWFKFSWFDSLCASGEFLALMEKYGEPQRCSRAL